MQDKFLRSRQHVAATGIVLACSGMAQVSYANDSDIFIFEEIVVTAQKRSQRLVDVPVSVAAVNAEAIEAAGIERLSGIVEQVPNVSVRANSGLVSSIFVRGVGSHSRHIGFDPRVGIYLDGVYLGASPTLDQELIGIERVEVLKGPQGSLFGKNTVAGAIDIISKRPGEDFAADIKASIGNYAARKITAQVDLPITEGVAASVAVDKNDRDGFSKNLFNGDDMNERHSLTYRTQLAIDNIEDLELRISVDGMDTDENINFGEPLTDVFGIFKNTTSAKHRELNQNHTSYEEKDIFGVAVNASYTLANDFSLRSITSHRETDYHMFADVDYTEIDLMVVDYQDEFEQFIQELQLVSPSDGGLDYIIGLYYYQQDGTTDRSALAGALGPLLLGIPSGDGLLNFGSVETTSYAIFTNITYDLTDRLELGVGFRLGREKKAVDWNLDSGGYLGIATIDMEDERTDTDFAPTATLNYAITGQLIGVYDCGQCTGNRIAGGGNCGLRFSG